MKDIYTDDLRTFTVDEFYAILNGIGDERPRLELKREISPREIAWVICALANAEGGLIVVGIDNPKPGQDLAFSPTAPDVSDAAVLRISSSANALAYPAPPFEVVGLKANAAGNTLIVVRVEPSNRGPHEYIGSDNNIRLPIRRGTQNISLGLSDIESLQRRRDGLTNVSPLKHKTTLVTIQHYGTGDDVFFGLHISPVTYGRARILDTDDDKNFVTIEELTRGTDEHIHPVLSYRQSLMEGYYMADVPNGNNLNAPRPKYQLQIDADGDITIRFRQREAIAIADQYMAIFLTGYCVAQEVLFDLGLSPFANVWLNVLLGSSAVNSGVANAFGEDFQIDLARQSFGEAFVGTMMHMFRTANRPSKRDSVTQMLEHFADTHLPFANKMRSQWTSP